MVTSNQAIHVLLRYTETGGRCIIILCVTISIICTYLYTANFNTRLPMRVFHKLKNFLESPDTVRHNDTLKLMEWETLDVFGENAQPLPTRGPNSRNSTTFSQGVRHSATLNVTYISSTIAVLGLHRLQDNRQFGVFSADSFSPVYTYSFLLPLTTFAWKRLGYGSIVLIVGELNTWTRKPPLDYILRHTLDKGAVVVFLEGVHRHHAVMMSQCSRLFVASLLSPAVDLNSSVLVTSDADLWPLQSYLFQAPPFADPLYIISTNSFCCSPFEHRGNKHRMLPLANIVASAAIWRSLVAQKGAPPRNSDEIMTYLAHEFGALSRTAVNKGENAGWFMDQHMVSLLIEEWQRTKGNSSVRLVGRDISRDRIDANRWQPWRLDGLTDAHVLQETYRPSIWRKIQPLLKLMYGWTSQNYIWCENYRRGFLELIAF